MEAARTSKTLVNFYQTTRCYNPEDSHLRGIGWLKIGIWRLRGVWGNTEQGMCPMCNKEEGWSHILRCAETRRWREELVDKDSQILNQKL
jgi:hypothetical protein